MEKFCVAVITATCIMASVSVFGTSWLTVTVGSVLGGAISYVLIERFLIED